MPDRNELFAYGDGTLMQLREQRWELDELTRAMMSMQRRLDSIDAALAR